MKFANLFYPSDKNEINKIINNNLKNSYQIDQDKKIIAIIVPHAGYFYSGSILINTIKITNYNYENIIILAPSHNYFIEKLIIPKGNIIFNTPFGNIKTNEQIINELYNKFYNNIHQNNEIINNEHAIEVLLPIIKKFHDKVKVIPIVCNYNLKSKDELMIQYLEKISENSLIIVSSDFMHYGKNFNFTPFANSNNLLKNIEKMDKKAIDLILKIDEEKFYKYVKHTGITICGINPIILLLKILKYKINNNFHINGKLLYYNNSGNINNDLYNCVSYAGLAFFNNK